MYLQPWQIFLSGCVCGIVITIIVIIAILIRVITTHGVKVEHVKEEKEEDENG